MRIPSNVEIHTNYLNTALKSAVALRHCNSKNKQPSVARFIKCQANHSNSALQVLPNLLNESKNMDKSVQDESITHLPLFEGQRN